MKQDEIVSAPAPARLFPLRWSDAGNCWSFLGESPKIAKILAEKISAKPKLKFNHVCKKYQKQLKPQKLNCKHKNFAPKSSLTLMACEKHQNRLHTTK